MLDRKKLDQMEEHGAAAALQYRGELSAELGDSVSSTYDAVNAYFNDQKKRAAAIADRVGNLREDISDIDEKISSFGPALAQATISGDSAALEAIQKEIADLESRKTANKAQIGLLGETHISGDEALYQAADEAAEKMEAIYREKLAEMNALVTFANKQISLWARVADLSTLGGDTIPVNSVRSKVADMRQDFSAED